MNKLTAAVALSAALAAGCGSTTAATTASTATTAAAAAAPSGSSGTTASTAAFCASARALGSLSKGTQDAMAMSPAESAKDFEALGVKITALRTGAPADLVPAIDTVAARVALEAKAESMMVADPNGASAETGMLADHRTADDAAAAKLVAGVKTTCNLDIS